MIDKIADRLKEINQNIAKNFNIKIIEQEIMPDHIHILFESKPSICLSPFVHNLRMCFC